MKQIKIAHIQLLPIMSGVQKIMIDFLSRLDKDLYEIYVICQAEGDMTRILEKNGIRCIYLPELKREVSPVNDFIAFAKLLNIFKNYQFDVVHSHSSKPGFLGRISARLAGIPCIVHTVHGFAFHEFSAKLKIHFFTLLERIAALAADRIIFLNKVDYQFALEKNIVSRNKVAKINNGVQFHDLDLSVDVIKKKQELGIKPESKVVGFFGRLWEQKSPQDFVNSIPSVIKELPETEFIMVGDGPLLDDLLKNADRLSVRKNLKLLGWRNDVPELLKIIDVFVQTSLWEGMSLSILEAMAAGKPVVATDIKGNNEIVINNETGYLVSPNSPQQIADRVVTLLNNPELAAQMGAAAHNRIENEFDIDSHVKTIEDIYFSILEQKKFKLKVTHEDEASVTEINYGANHDSTA